jgi:predicted CXXCH cytochrome family protein
MCRWFLGAVLSFLGVGSLAAQDIDANITTQNRSPSTIADQISDPAERAAFLTLFKKDRPADRLGRAQAFKKHFPRSAFLFLADDVAARASFERGDFVPGRAYARESLQLLPENPLLLVSVADVEAQQHLDDAAISDARDAVEYLDRFAAPVTVSQESWPKIRDKLKAAAEFAVGRALLDKALTFPRGQEREASLKDCMVALSEAQRLNPSDDEVRYLKGLAELASGDLQSSAGTFARIYQANDALSSKAFGNLQVLYKMLPPDSGRTFERFVQQAEHHTTISSATPPNSGRESSSRPHSDYAGTNSCRGCHSEIYRQWSETGMSKMLRPYAPENVIGDFQRGNEFYLEDHADYREGKVEFARSPKRTLFARMVIRNGRHYFDILQSDGRWHEYPVDYTIGSKFQQAYATKLPNGEIHVFPIQYSVIQKSWVNYWKIIDGPASERADLRSWEKLDAATSYQGICAVCHTSQLRNIAGGGFDVTSNVVFREPGIDCEMCHGPSAQHVVEMTLNEPYPKPPIDPPVNFREIDNRDFVRICSQCHMQSAIRIPGESGELNYSRAGEFFPSNASISFGEFSRIGFYKDGRFRQTTFIVEALQRSQCFKRGQVSCGNCHDPHGHGAASNPTSLKFQEQPDLMCTSCHSKLQDTASIAVHTHHRVDSEGSRCVSCHMPRIMDAVLFLARTHQIDDIPNSETTLRFGQEESPNACLLCHSGKDAAWVKQELTGWKSTPRQ